MRARDIIRSLRKLGVSESEIKSTSDYNDLLDLLNGHENGNSLSNNQSPLDLFSEENQNYALVLIFTVIVISIASYVYPVKDVIDAIEPKNRFHGLLLSVLSLLVGGNVILAILRLIELCMQLYVSYARMSTFASWILSSDSTYRYWLAPMFHFNLSVDPNNPSARGFDVGPMVTLWICNQIINRISAYILMKVTLQETIERKKKKKEKKLKKLALANK